MQEAFELELKTEKNPITPGQIVQVGVIFGDLLLEEGRPAKCTSKGIKQRHLGKFTLHLFVLG